MFGSCQVTMSSLWSYFLLACRKWVEINKNVCELWMSFCLAHLPPPPPPKKKKKKKSRKHENAYYLQQFSSKEIPDFFPSLNGCVHAGYISITISMLLLFLLLLLLLVLLLLLFFIQYKSKHDCSFCLNMYRWAKSIQPFGSRCFHLWRLPPSNFRKTFCGFLNFQNSEIKNSQFASVNMSKKQGHLQNALEI